MKARLLMVLLSLLSPYAVFADSLGCVKAASAFVKKPSRSSLSAVSGASEDRCWAYVKSSPETLGRVIKTTEDGNSWAAQYLARNLHSLDGGGLEDALRAMGLFGEHDMERLLRLVEDGLLSKINLADAITMLPLSISDNPRAEKWRLAQRRHLVVAVTRPELAEEKDVALKAIDELMPRIEAAIVRGDRIRNN